MKRWLTRLKKSLLSSDFDKSDEFDPEVYGDKQFSGRTDEVYVNYGKIVLDLLRPTSFVDVGCANAYLPNYLRECGIGAWGIEGADAAFNHMPKEIKPYVTQLDLRQAWTTAQCPSDDATFDVVNFTEVAEHLKKENESTLQL